MKNTYKIYQLKETVSHNSTYTFKNLTTREAGKMIREVIESKLRSEQEGIVVILDFSRVGPIDYSYADEIIAKLIVRLNAMEYGDKFIAVTGLSKTQEENIHVALERKKLHLLSIKPARKPQGGNKEIRGRSVTSLNGWHILGILNPYLRDVLHIVMERQILSARELANLRNMKINSASTKLLNLYKARLVKRCVQNLPDRGRQYVYKSLI